MSLPLASGTYVLQLALSQPHSVTVGRLGHFLFSAGHYFYVGSAFGPGGLRARIERHLRGSNRPHWHIDYLRAVATIKVVYYVTAQSLECCWAQALLQDWNAAAPVSGFGASDCHTGCAAHLLQLPQPFSARRLCNTLAHIAGAPIERHTPYEILVHSLRP